MPYKVTTLTNSKIDEVREALCDNPDFCRFFKNIDDRLNELLPIVPAEAQNKLYEAETAVNGIIHAVLDVTYRKGVQDAVKLTDTGRKPKYICLEMESHRKDALKLHSWSKTGWAYKITRILKEYTDEAEADRDMARLKTGEITEGDLISRKAHRTAKLI